MSQYAAKLFLKFGYSQYEIDAVNLFKKLNILEMYNLRQTIFIKIKLNLNLLIKYMYILYIFIIYHFKVIYKFIVKGSRVYKNDHSD